MTEVELQWKQGEEPRDFGSSTQKVLNYHVAKIEEDLYAYLWEGVVVGSSKDSWWNWEIQDKGRRVIHGNMYTSEEVAMRAPYGLIYSIDQVIRAREKNMQKVKRFKQKPVEVEAVQYEDDGTIVPLLIEMKYKLTLAFNHDGMYIVNRDGNDLFVAKGDYVFKDCNGDFWALKAKAFESRYDELF